MKQETQITRRYQIISKLGQGGMGAVWRVYDRLEKTEVALKQVLIPDKQLDFASKAGTDDTDKLRLSLAQEFSILATLRHPYILSVLDFGFDGEAHPFYTMTLLEGATDCKTYGINLARSRRIVLMGQMLQALHYLHRRGILHRDLKPDNVFVTRDEQVKVMDFGLAKRDKQQSTQSDIITGTIAYMAPEQFQGEGASVASDLFAVGVMVYEIMVGQHPFEAKTIVERIMKIMTHPPDFSAIPDDFVPWLETILEKDPAKRFPTAYDAMIEFYKAVGVERPAEDQTIRESFLQASEFVGRDAELKQLTAALETLDTQNAFFLIGGESGVGKSRLLEELRVRAVVTGAGVLRGQGVEGGGLPFQLWRNIVQHLLLVVEVTDLQASVLKDMVPDVGELLRRDIPDTPELTGGAYQERMVLTIVDLFRNLRQPTVLLLEDLQWTTESLAVLEQVLKVREQLSQLMIVASYRDDEASNLPEKLTGMTHIKLERLTADAVSELSSAMLGEGGKNEEVVKLLHSQSEGNLFFLVETVRALAEASGDLQRIGQGKLPEGVFTGGMQALTRRRLNKVDAQYHKVQMLAAVIGREIDTKLLEHAYDEATVQAWLSNAANYNVVIVQGNRWRFAHDKLRETVIADIPDETLPQIHRNAAETIEAIYPDDAGYNEALLAHWQATGDLDKTYQYLLPVAKYMIEISGTYIIVEAHLHHMLERLPKDDGRCIALWNLLADSAERQGNYRASQGYALQAQELAILLDDREGLANSLNNLGYIAYSQGEYARATDLFQQSLVINQQLDDQRGIAVSLNNLGNIAMDQGEYARATDLFQQSLVISQQLGAQRGIARSLSRLGLIAMDQGEYAHATDLFQQSLVISQQLGDQERIANTLSNIGSIAIDTSDYKRADDLTQQSLAIYQQLDKKQGVRYCLNNLGLIAFYTGSFARAKALLEQSLTISQQLDDKFNSALTMSHIAWLLLQQRLPDARVKFYDSLLLSIAVGSPPLQAFNIVGLAGVLHQSNTSLRSTELLGMVQVHPSTERMIRQRINALMSELETALPAEDLQAALERGKSLDLDKVVQELLVEFEFAPPDTV